MNITEEAVEAAAKAMAELGESDNGESWWPDFARAALEAAAPHMFAGVTALADNWEAQGEYDMAYSKNVTDEDIALQLLQSGAQMVDDARLVRNAIGGKP